MADEREAEREGKERENECVLSDICRIITNAMRETVREWDRREQGEGECVGPLGHLLMCGSLHDSLLLQT